MVHSRLVTSLIFVPFFILSLYALTASGLVELFHYLVDHPWGWQVFFDLAIALLLVLGWIYKDARARGRNPWIWVVATVMTGSVAPLLYLITNKQDAPE